MTELSAAMNEIRRLRARLSVYEAPRTNTGVGPGHVLYTTNNAPESDLTYRGELHTIRCSLCGVTGSELRRNVCEVALTNADTSSNLPDEYSLL